MDLNEIAEKLVVEDGYSKTYRKKLRKNAWLKELLNKAYVALSERIKIHTERHEWLPWQDACTILDKVVLTTVCVYEERLRQLEKEVNELKNK